MHINPAEIAISALLFLFMWWVLGVKLLKPFFEMLSERETRTTGAGEVIQKKRERMNSLKAQIEEELLETRLEGISFRDSFVNKAKSESSEIVATAMSKARGELDEARKRLTEIRIQAQGEIQKEAGELSQVVMERILKTGPRPTVH